MLRTSSGSRVGLSDWRGHMMSGAQTRSMASRRCDGLKPLRQCCLPARLSRQDERT